MREYETVFICNPNLTDPKQKQLVDRLQSLIEKHKGRVFFARNMGKKSLAYPVRKQGKGIYTCLDYAAGGKVVEDLERNMRLDENVLRFFTVVKAKDIDVEARAAEIAAKGEDAEPAPSNEAVAETNGGETEEEDIAGDIH